MAYEDLTEWELLGKAAAALRRVESLPVGSPLRAIQWAVYDSYKAELDERALKAIAQAARQARGLPCGGEG